MTDLTSVPEPSRDTAKLAMMSLALRSLVFTAVVPGLGGVYVPWLILTRHGESPRPMAWLAVSIISIGVVLYFSCLWFFGAVGRGTPGLWDSPRRVVTVGPYKWVRNPIYIGALLIVSGEAWLFHSVGLVFYTVALAIAFHVIVLGYEEPRLRVRFGEGYEIYRQTVSRWIPHSPHQSRL
jgi:protein-S-isoprenylcysteine O-methyltransferase Ste14